MKLLQVLAVLAGTFKIFGIFSGILFFIGLGETLAVSPSPNPYGHVRTVDQEKTSTGVSIGCLDTQGHQKWRIFDYITKSEIPGPHRRGVTFLTYFLLVSNDQRTIEEDSRITKQTRYYFCDNGPLAQVIHCSGDVKSGLIRLSGSEGTEMSMPCSQ